MTTKTSCYDCKHKRNVPGDAHIACANPDPNMTGSPHGIKNGWFIYPFLFDPIWRTKECSNFFCKKKVISPNARIVMGVLKTSKKSSEASHQSKA